jgi:hypothetical protein
MPASGPFVRRNGFKVCRGWKSRPAVELIDGSTIWTDGMVLVAKLQFDIPFAELPSLDHDKYLDFAAGLSSRLSNEPEIKVATFVCDLHVIEDLPSDIILSGEFIFKNHVFTKFHGLFVAVADAECPEARMTPEDCLLFMRKRKSWWRPRWSARARRTGGTRRVCGLLDCQRHREWWNMPKNSRDRRRGMTITPDLNLVAGEALSCL